LKVTARRGQQYCGTPDSPDVVSEIPVHFEVKRTEALSLYDAMEKAATECGLQVPVVVHKRNNRDWLFIVRAIDIKSFCQTVHLCLDSKNEA